MFVFQHPALPGDFQTPFALQVFRAPEHERATQVLGLFVFWHRASQVAFIWVHEFWAALQPSCALAIVVVATSAISPNTLAIKVFIVYLPHSLWEG